MQPITIIATTPLFPLGQIVATPGAIDAAKPGEIAQIIARHAGGDWGEVCPEDAAENDRSVLRGYRLLSAYTVNETRLWIITESDRSVTTVLLPEEY